MIRVLQINAVYGRGSTGTIVRDIENLCFRRGIECYVASADPKVLESNNGYVIGGYLDHKIHALFSRIGGKQAYFSKRPTQKLINYILQIRPNVIHLHNLHNNYINLPLLLSFIAHNDIATIITLHDCWFYTGGCYYYTIANCNKWRERCGKCPKRMFDTPAFFKDCSSEIFEDRKNLLLAIPRLLCIGVSEWITNEARCSFLKEKKINTILNGIDVDTFRPVVTDVRHKLGLEGKYIIMGLASKWLSIENKNALQTFINRMKGDEVLFLFGCDNVQRNIASNVFLYGYTENRKALAALYTMADVFANCSREDALSLINLEAQACGTPIVTYDGSGPAETVDNINSYSVTVGAADLLYDTVQKVRKYTAPDTAKKCRDFVINKFGLKDNYLKYISFYKEMSV